MNEIQTTLHASFKFLIDYLNSNDIKYFAIGGTSLGAYRHKGFIPWDDDIDIGIPRFDYDKLINIIRHKANSLHPYSFLSIENNSDYVYPFIKFINTNFGLIEKKFPKNRIGLFIDIFPLDGLSNDSRRAIKQLNRIRLINKSLIYRSMKYRDLGFFRGVIKLISTPFPKKLIYRILKMQQTKYTYKDSKYVANTVGSWGNKEIMDKCIFSGGEELEFEGLSVNCPQKIREYLGNLYNNFEELPPVEKRITHHDFYIIKNEKEK